MSKINFSLDKTGIYSGNLKINLKGNCFLFVKNLRFTPIMNQNKHFYMPSFQVRWKIKFLRRALNPYSKCGLHNVKGSPIQVPQKLEAPLV